MDTTQEWFKTWFDTDYYHLLYRHRDDNEAAFFIQRLLDKLGLEEGDKVMDLACGKGRHSITMHDAGMEVVGLDLSQNNIDHVKQFEQEGLHFYRWDMRDPFSQKGFRAVMNLFTSFGYFDSMEDNARVLQAVHTVLAQKGLFVLDYLNPDAISQIDEQVLEQEVEEITFRTKKSLTDNKVIKEIAVQDGTEVHRYQESVQLIDVDTFRDLFKSNGFEILKIFGDYDLSRFDRKSSPRIILLAEKKD